MNDEKLSLKWSKWYRLSALQKNNFEDIPDKDGVYQIRCTTPEGKPMEICRATSIDKEGILYIGSSTWLRERIKSFWKTINGNIKSHSRAKTYYYYNFDQHFPKERLEVRWALVDNPEEIEKQLLNIYLRKYLDTPPLNMQASREI